MSEKGVGEVVDKVAEKVLKGSKEGGGGVVSLGESVPKDVGEEVLNETKKFRCPPLAIEECTQDVTVEDVVEKVVEGKEVWGGVPFSLRVALPRCQPTDLARGSRFPASRLLR